MPTEPELTKRLFPNNLKRGLVTVIAGTLALGALSFCIKTCIYYNWPKKIENTVVTRVGTTTVAYDTYATDYLFTSLDYKDIPTVYVTDHDRCIASENLLGIVKGIPLKKHKLEPVKEWQMR